MNKDILLFLLFIPVFVFGQKQVKIDWPSLANSPWPVLRGDMQGTGRSDFIGPRSLHIAWKKDMPYGIFRGPVIGYSDNLYMGDDLFVQTDSVNHFYAVDKNGNDLWTFDTPGFYPNDGGPILNRDSSVYFFSPNKNMYALDKNGKLKWKLNIWADFWPQYPIDKSGFIYVPIKDTICVVSSEGNIKKKIFLPNISPALSFSIGGDTIFATTGGVVSKTGSLAAMDLNGNILWTRSFPHHNSGVPLVDNQNKIYVFGADSSYNYYLYCIKPNGTMDWQYPVEAIEDGSSPSMDINGNIVFFCPISIGQAYKGQIVSLDHNGNKKWSTTLEGDWFHNFVSIGLVCDAEGKIYGGGSTPGGNFYCLDSNGVVLWTYTSGIFEYDSCPAIGSDGTLYIGYHNDGSVFCTQNLIAIKDSVTSINDAVENIKEFQLQQNYPNPFNPTTLIKYQIPKSGLVSLKIYDILGNEVVTLVNENKEQGFYTVTFDASKLSSGVYIYQLKSNDYSASKKMVLVK
ncbi:MAG: PQQ-binding-like beta-propeller repeat protein [Ignavibacteriaceae bacterium]|nr:PQQ-binding-like beta-propeller repeat protein [Ignavibacteriaceae bacterium]